MSVRSDKKAKQLVSSHTERQEKFVSPVSAHSFVLKLTKLWIFQNRKNQLKMSGRKKKALQTLHMEAMISRNPEKYVYAIPFQYLPL